MDRILSSHGWYGYGICVKPLSCLRHHPTITTQYPGYVKDEAEGSLRIHVFMASVPADGEDLEFAEAFGEDEPIGRLSQGKKIQAFWGGEGSHLCGRFGRN